jgi:quercetin dioxygenase-like cupin family protein
MKTLTLNILLILASLIFIIPNRSFAQEGKKKELIAWTAEDIKWEPIPNAPAGAMSAKLWGDETKGAYGGLTKFPPGFKAPLHYHTNDMKIVIIKGAYIFNGKEYGPGSYLFIPGKLKHESAGSADSETIFFSEQPGKFDLVPMEPSK